MDNSWFLPVRFPTNKDTWHGTQIVAATPFQKYLPKLCKSNCHASFLYFIAATTECIATLASVNFLQHATRYRPRWAIRFDMTPTLPTAHFFTNLITIIHHYWVKLGISKMLSLSLFFAVRLWNLRKHKFNHERKKREKSIIFVFAMLFLMHLWRWDTTHWVSEITTKMPYIGSNKPIHNPRGKQILFIYISSEMLIVQYARYTFNVNDV